MLYKIAQEVFLIIAIFSSFTTSYKTELYKEKKSIDILIEQSQQVKHQYQILEIRMKRVAQAKLSLEQ